MTSVGLRSASLPRYPVFSPGSSPWRTHLRRVSSPERAIEQVKSDWSALKRSRTSWRLVAAAAAVVAVGLVAVLALALRGDDPGQTIVVESDTTTTGQVVLISKTWGTEVDIQLEGLPPGDRFVAWVVSTDGGWEQIAAWGPTRLNGARVTGASSVATDDVQSIVITEGDGRDRVATAEPADA